MGAICVEIPADLPQKLRDNFLPQPIAYPAPAIVYKYPPNYQIKISRTFRALINTVINTPAPRLD